MAVKSAESLEFLKLDGDGPWKFPFSSIVRKKAPSFSQSLSIMQLLFYPRASLLIPFTSDWKECSKKTGSLIYISNDYEICLQKAEQNIIKQKQVPSNLSAILSYLTESAEILKKINE